MGFLRRNSLTLCFLLLMVGALIGQALAGLADYNARRSAEGAGAISLGEYITSASYAVDVAENWQSDPQQSSSNTLPAV